MFWRIVVKRVLTVAAVVSMWGSGVQNAQAQNGPNVPLAPDPIVVVDGGARFSLAVPERDNRQQTNVSAADVPEGVVWMTPPSFPDAADHPSSRWYLWLTPQRSNGGSLWRGAELLHRFKRGSRPTLVGITGNRVLIGLQARGQAEQIYSYSLRNRKGLLIATVPLAAPSSYGFGAYSWVYQSNVVHVVNVSTGREFSVSVSGADGSAIQLVPGGIDVLGKIIRIPGVHGRTYPAIPHSFKWIALWHSTRPVVAIPSTWKVTQEHPGGSSIGLIASNPKDPKEKLALYFNACGGCYSPSVISPQMVNTLYDSPLMGLAPHETYAWLDDRTVAYTVPASKQSVYPTYGLTRTFTNQSGDEEVTLQIPSSAKHLATLILDSSLRVP